MHEHKLALRVRHSIANFLNGFISLFFRASSYVNGAIMLVQDLAELVADACVAAGDHEDAASLIRQVLLGQLGGRDPG